MMRGGAYQGRAGQTRTRTIHVAQAGGELVAATVHESIDASKDPELAARLTGQGAPLGAVTADGVTLRGDFAVTYHDPRVPLLVLVLPEADRHREIAARIELLQRLAADEASVPTYAKEFSVVYGPAGLRALLDGSAGAQAPDRALAEASRRPRNTLARIRPITAQRPAVTARPAPTGEHPPAIEAAEVESLLDGLEIPGGDEPSIVADAAAMPAPPNAQAVAADEASAEVAAAAPEAPAVEVATPPAEAGPSEPAAVEAAAIEVAAIEAATVEAAAEPESAVLDADAAGASVDETAATGVVERAEPAASPTEHEVVTAPFDVIDDADLHEDAAVAADQSPPSPSLASTSPSPSPSPSPSLASTSPSPSPSPSPSLASTSIPRVPTSELAAPAPLLRAARVSTAPPPMFERLREIADAELPADADPVTSEFFDEQSVGPLPPLGDDPWLVAFLDRRVASALALLGNEVRVAVRASAPRAERLKRGAVDVHLALHRVATGPVVTLAFGTPASIRCADRDACAIACVDVAAEADRAALVALGREFAITVDVFFDDGERRRGRVLARLAENAGFVLRAADDHRRTVAGRGHEVSFPQAAGVVLAPGYDLFGAGHADRDEFHEQSFARLDTASAARRALSVAARFTEPAREDYLVCTRGYPLSRWRDVRRGVLARAVEWGLWMGNDLAQVAVSEGFARSRRDLLARLGVGFDLLRSVPQFCDLDDATIADNLATLAAEAEAAGASALRPVLADPGLVAEPEPAAEPAPSAVAAASEPSRPSVDELLARLAQRATRLDAAVELCERGEARAIEPVMQAVTQMSRSEAVRVLGLTVRFGTAAAPALVAGLRSSKAFLRHGCALALAMLRTEAGADAVIELLLAEPTEIWREIARAVGQIGPPALMPLATQLGRQGDGASASARERVAWAMAHVAVRGGRAAVEALAGGTSIVAPVAQQALAFMAPASRDEVRVRPPGATGTQPGREMTVNRAFSKKFFEAVERGLPAVGAAELSAMEAAEPMELLDDADVVEDDD